MYNDAQRKKAETVVHRMAKRAVEMEGTVTVSYIRGIFLGTGLMRIG